MTAFIQPPQRIPVYLRLMLWVARRTAGRDLLPARLLAWYPPAAVGSGVMEALAVHSEGRLNERLLKLVRLQVSLAAACPFCLDMNSFEAERQSITPAELAALRGEAALAETPSFSPEERLALTYARALTATPPIFPPDLIAALRRAFSERELVALAATAAQVNYWARLLQALGVPPAGFTTVCAVPGAGVPIP